MKAHWSYFKYIIKHKWHVFRGCIYLGVPLYQAIIHDWVKFLPIEFPAYVHQFYNEDGTKRNVRDKTGAYDPNVQSLEFKCAWLHHQKQPHHWQSWISIGDNGSLVPLPIPQRFVLEMVADWYGAGMAISGRNDVENWYLSNGHKMIIEEETQIRIIQAILKIKDK